MALATGSFALAAIIFASLSQQPALFKISLATAYIAAGLFGITFALAPLYYLRRRSMPISTYLRRDVSIWAGVYAIAHVFFGLQVHLNGRMWEYFIFPDAGSRKVPLRYDAFGLTNYAGLIATIIVVVLLCLSNDASIRRLGAKRWKALQRCAYALAIVTIAHAIVYQFLERRSAIYVAFFCAVIATVGMLRWAASNAKKSRSP